MKKASDSFELIFIPKKSSPGQIEILRRLLFAQGVKPENLVESTFNGQERITVYFTSKERLQRFRTRIGKTSLQNVKIQSKTVKTQDWQTVWKKEYKPFALTKKFEIVPYGYRKTHRCRGREPVYIDTSYAFGTGLHATTRFMAGFIEQCEGRFNRFIDIGTGTGILAVLALKCGATDVTAIDLRRDIIEIANMNFRENGYEKQRARAINFQKYQSSQPFDYVAANLITMDLIAFRKDLMKLVKKGGYLAVSGISLVQYPDLRKAFKNLPLRCLKIEKGEGWCALLFRRPE